MLESFNETETHSFSFYPGGHVETGVCGHSSDNGALHWDDTSGLKYTTSQQLIVQENFMLQFKVQPRNDVYILPCMLKNFLKCAFRRKISHFTDLQNLYQFWGTTAHII